jgi:hypothetical protein
LKQKSTQLAHRLKQKSPKLAYPLKQIDIFAVENQIHEVCSNEISWNNCLLGPTKAIENR